MPTDNLNNDEEVLDEEVLDTVAPEDEITEPVVEVVEAPAPVASSTDEDAAAKERARRRHLGYI